MKKALLGKESYLEQALSDQFRTYISDVTFVEYDEDGLYALLTASNQFASEPCSLKTDGRRLWLYVEDEETNQWVDMGAYDLNSYIPKDVKAVFVEHYEAIDIVKSYNFSQADLTDLLGIMYSRLFVTEEQLKEELDAAQSVFQMSSETQKA